MENTMKQQAYDDVLDDHLSGPKSNNEKYIYWWNFYRSLLPNSIEDLCERD